MIHGFFPSKGFEIQVTGVEMDKMKHILSGPGPRQTRIS